MFDFMDHVDSVVVLAVILKRVTYRIIMTCYDVPVSKMLVHPPLVAAQIAVHPLVVMNMSDHWTRSSKAGGVVIGILLGQTLNSKLSMITSFELLVDNRCESSVSIVEANAKEHMERLLEVFPGVDAVGWYTCGDKLSREFHSTLHDRLTRMFENEAMLLLIMDPTATFSANEEQSLPLYAFERGGNRSAAEFAQVVYSIEADELEGIAVNAAINAETQASTDASAATKAASVRLSDTTKILRRCMQVISDYLAFIAENRGPPNAELLRRIGTLCHRLPTSNTDLTTSSSLKAAQEREQLNALMAVYLGALGTLVSASDALSNLSTTSDTGRMWVGRGGRR